MICICICISILARAAHFEDEQASVEIFQEVVYSHSCLNIFLYIVLLFRFLPGLPHLVNTNTNFGVMGTMICVVTHII